MTVDTVWYIFWAYTLFAVVVLVMTLLVVILAVAYMPKIYDNIHLRAEILIVSFILCMAAAIEFVTYAASAFRGITTLGNADLLSQILYFMVFSISSVASFAIIVISTQYVPWMVRRNQSEQLPALALVVADSNDVACISLQDVDFEVLVSTRHGLAEFLKFLTNEVDEQMLHNLVVECAYTRGIYNCFRKHAKF